MPIEVAHALAVVKKAAARLPMHEAHVQGQTLREAALASGEIDAETFDRVVDRDGWWGSGLLSEVMLRLEPRGRLFMKRVGWATAGVVGLAVAAFCAYWFGMGQTSYKPAPETRVAVEGGDLEGSAPAPGVRAYFGIPYAKPPVGPLRWQPPRPADGWTGTRIAVKHGAPCVQRDFGWNRSSAEHGSEDCLFLNVWAPANGDHHPVMVYIHGGSNVAGSATEELSNGFGLVPRGVVLVTLNYRVGIFGFLRTPALDVESAHHASGNYGVLDQIAALGWVQRNIARFGGDPGNVMIFGQSAGSVDTGLLMTSPLARPMFQKALEESGQVLGLMPTSTREQSEAAWAPVAKELGTDLPAMRERTAAEVLAADSRVPRPTPEQGWGWRGASVDGWVLPEMPAEVFAAGREAPVPLLIGSNVQEIVPKGQTEAVARHSIETRLGAEDGAKLEAAYAQPGADPNLGDLGARWATDRDFRCAVRQVAEWHAAHGFPTYVYQFDRPVPGRRTAEHSSELHFVFHYFSGQDGTGEDDAVSKLMEQYWTSFAATGTPNGAGAAVTWPAYAGGGLYLHVPVSGTTPDVRKDLGGDVCRILMSHAGGRW